MPDPRLSELITLLDRFARTHWNDEFHPDRAALTIDGSTLRCTVGDESIEGDARAPLRFVTGAWALIYAHECAGRYGHRIDGKVNRVWPNGAGASPVDHRLDDTVQAFAKLWPGLLFSSSLYRDVGTPGHPGRPRCMDDAPSNTTLTGILKRVVASASDPDPLERLKVAEFVENQLRREWSATAEDAMMKVVGKPLLELARDDEPAVRELALLALDKCAERCWAYRAYGLYENICRLLIDAGVNTHLQYARLAESAYASGDIAQGDRLWGIASAGMDPLRSVKMSSAYDHIGDWSDLHTRILRQAGGAQYAYANGFDPNEARQAKLAKKGIVAPDPQRAARHRELAATLLARAATQADARLAIDLPAIREGRKVPIGGGEIDPAGRRLFLAEIFMLQAALAHAAGDADERLRLLFKTLDVEWQLHGGDLAWRGNDADVVALAASRDDATLARLGMPAYLSPLVAEARAATKLAGSDEGREQLFWHGILRTVREQMMQDSDFDYNPIPGDELVADFVITRDGGQMTFTHPVLAEPVSGPLSTPVLNALRAWHAAWLAAHGEGTWYNSADYKIITFDAEGVAMLARIAAETLDAGARDEAIALYRFAHGTDPLMQPWPYRDPVQPLAIEEVPADLREAVARRSPLAEHDGHAAVKPRGRRAELLAADFISADPVTARYIAQCMRSVCYALRESEIDRFIKSGPPLLLALWQHEDAQVREAAIIAIMQGLHAFYMHAPREDVSALLTAANEAGIADLKHVIREPEEHWDTGDA